MKLNSRLSKLIIILTMLALVPACFAGTTNVTATVQDPNGQVFSNGTVTATFVPNPSTGSATYLVGGSSFPQLVTGVLNGSGALAITLTDNATITPALSKWNITVCPQATAQCSQYIGTITGANLVLTSQINAIVPVIVVQPNLNVLPMAYQDSEISGPLIGTVYYNTTSNTARIFNGTVWSSLAGSSSAWASGGVISGVLCKSNGAGLCLDSALTDNGTNVVSTEPILLPDGNASAPSLALASATQTGFYKGSAGTILNFSTSGFNRLAFGANNGLALGADGIFAWTAAAGNVTSFDTALRRNGVPASIVQGLANSASPIAQTFTLGESSRGGTDSNIGGANGTIRAGNGTGTGGGGTLNLQTSAPGSTGTVADVYATGLSINNAQAVSMPVSASSPHIIASTDLKIASSQALTGVQGSTGTNVFSCTGSFTSGNFVKTDANGNCVDGGSNAGGLKVEYADGTILSNSTGIMKTTTIGASEITSVGQVFHIRTHGQATDNGGATGVSAQLTFKLDSTTVCSSATSSGGINSTSILMLDVYLIVTATGASGSYVFSCDGMLGPLTSAGLSTTGFSTAVVPIDWTVSHAWNFIIISTSLGNAKQGLTEIDRLN